MIPVFQTRFTSHDRAILGNCFQAAVASLLDKPLEDVPDFTEFDRHWEAVLENYLQRNGYELLGCFYFTQEGDWTELLKVSSGLDGYFICGGKSPREHVSSHAIVMRDGAMVHDPHPRGEGLLTIDYAYLIERTPCQKSK